MREYTTLEVVLSLTTDLEEGVGLEHSRSQMETDNLLLRARSDGIKVEVVVRATTDCKTRRKPPPEPVNLPAPPSGQIGEGQIGEPHQAAGVAGGHGVTAASGWARMVI